MRKQDTKEFLVAAPDLVDSDEIQEIVAAFVDEVSGYIVVINQAMAESDFQTIGRLGHTIKGDSMAVGFEDITNVGASIEQAAKIRDSEQIPQFLSRLAEQVEQVKKSLG